MDDLTNTAAFYYSTVFVLTSAFCVALILFLQWPLLAEIPLAICILIQAMSLSKNVYNIWDENGDGFVAEAYAKTKTVFNGIDPQEEEYLGR